MHLFDYPLAVFVGLALAVGVWAGAALVGFSRERNFYPLVVIVTASYYGLFALLGGTVTALWSEVGVTFLFVALAVAGYRSTDWIAVAALIGHAVFDAVHGGLIDNAGVPPWWPSFCLTFDVVMAALVAWRLRAARPATAPSAL